MHFRRINLFALILKLLVKGLIFMPSKRELELKAARNKLLYDKDYYRTLRFTAYVLGNTANSCKEDPYKLSKGTKCHKELLKAIADFDKSTKTINAGIADIYNPCKHRDSFEGTYDKKNDLQCTYPQLKKLLKYWWKVKDKESESRTKLKEINFKAMYDEAERLSKAATEMESHIDKLISDNSQNEIARRLGYE